MVLPEACRGRGAGVKLVPVGRHHEGEIRMGAPAQQYQAHPDFYSTV